MASAERKIVDNICLSGEKMNTVGNESRRLPRRPWRSAKSLWRAYLDDIVFSFRKHKELAEKAVRQVGDEGFFQKLGAHSNSIAVIIKHVAGNLASRWTDFLTTDGDKPWRDRDAEFIVGPDDTREHLMAA
jgi:hypothetical protein